MISNLAVEFNELESWLKSEEQHRLIFPCVMHMRVLLAVSVNVGCAKRLNILPCQYLGFYDFEV